MAKPIREACCIVCKCIIPLPPPPRKRRGLYCLYCKKNKKTIKRPNGRSCKICHSGLKGRQKYFCNSVCQAIGAKIRQTKPRTKKICLFCRQEFSCLVSVHKINNYCSRICKDNKQKIAYQGSGNPGWARKSTKREKEIRSKFMIKRWAEDKSFREKVLRGQQRSMDETGYWPGTSEQAKDKKRRTNIKKYGVEHPWSNPEIRSKCEVTCLELYGKHSWSLSPKADTTIEKKIANILSNNNIQFKKQYRIYIVGRVYKQYDFFLPKNNLLIEADGDYWHGNPVIYKQLNEMQETNYENDLVKNKLATERGYILLRYWETDINKDLFEEVLLREVTNVKR